MAWEWEALGHSSKQCPTPAPSVGLPFPTTAKWHQFALEEASARGRWRSAMWQLYLCRRHPSLASLPTCHRLWPPTAIHPKREEQSLLHPQGTGPCLCDVPSPPPTWASHLPTRPPPASQEDQESPSAAPWATEAQPSSAERYVGHVMVIESQVPPGESSEQIPNQQPPTGSTLFSVPVPS